MDPLELTTSRSHDRFFALLGTSGRASFDIWGKIVRGCAILMPSCHADMKLYTAS